jgi:hypothetical protein
MAHKARGVILLEPGVAVHCSNRFNTYERVPMNRAMKRLMVEIAQKLQAYYWVTVAVNIPMTTHIHLIIAGLCRLLAAEEVARRYNQRFKGKRRQITPDDPRIPTLALDMITLSSFMRDFDAQVAQEYNRRYGYRGRLWRDRFSHVLLLTDAHLLNSAFYAELNPNRAQIVERPQENEFSTIAAWLVAPDRGPCPEFYTVLRYRRGLSVAEYTPEDFHAEMCAGFERRLPGWNAPQVVAHPALVVFAQQPGVPAWAADPLTGPPSRASQAA